MTIAERMVEAAARASVAFAYNDTLATDDASFAQWREEYGDAWEQERRCARASLTAALALAEEAGALLVRVPTNADQWDSPGYDHGTPPNIIWADGHNAHRAATLAGRVWP